MELDKNQKSTLQKEFRRKLRDLLLQLSDSSEGLTDKAQSLLEHRRKLRTEDMEMIMNKFKENIEPHKTKIGLKDSTMFKEPLILVYDIDFSEWYNEKTESILYESLSVLYWLLVYKEPSKDLPINKMSEAVDEATKDKETGELNDFGKILQDISKTMMKDKDPMQMLQDIQTGNIGDMVTNMSKIIEESGVDLENLQKSSEKMMQSMGMDNIMQQFGGAGGVGGAGQSNMMGNMMQMMMQGGEEEMPELTDKIDPSTIDQKYIDMVRNSSTGKHSKRNARRRERNKQAKQAKQVESNESERQ